MAAEQSEQVVEADGVITVDAERAGDAVELAASGAWWAFFRAHRIFNLRVNIPGAVPGNLLWASLTECTPGSNIPQLGSATTHTYNVVPQDGFVLIRGEIDWDEDLLIRVSLLFG
ncbi:hypothetical protein F9278_16830 [Streptomyces phaeolivaceus]|uniref:Uncharacterized protein n=1 Tax=Streptomyces phaeolivaceus TaxID=2653200 RepID=A0A5P8K3N0_9ACTN|nr:hypothetical protein [Streptomyces phaeolivaceus]QFQ97610.1 hypothetical protein F9278_16830 [Streptomyces phaeolivaceus]